jgi:hypothetical protein
VRVCVNVRVYVRVCVCACVCVCAWAHVFICARMYIRLSVLSLATQRS